MRKSADRLRDDYSKWLTRWEDLGVKDPHMGQLHRQKVERLDKANRNSSIEPISTSCAKTWPR